MNLSEKNEVTFDGRVYEADNPEMFIYDLGKIFERYYGNEKIASDANMKIDFMEFSVSEDYTVLIKFDEDSNIEGGSIGSYGWLY